MAKQTKQLAAPKRVKFDEARYFKYLRENADPHFLNFLRSIDKRACVQMYKYVLFYVRRPEEKEFFAARKNRGVELKKAVSRAIRNLHDASTACTQLVKLELPRLVPLGQPGSRLWHTGINSFIDALKTQEEKLAAFLDELKKLYNEKRLGVSGNHMWLVMLQEFVTAWTIRELGESREIRVEEIATMIEATKATLGWREDKTETDADLLRKAISAFRKNHANGVLLSSQIVPSAQKQCDVVASGPYLLGIEI